MSKREFLEILSGFGFVEDILLCCENNTIEIKMIKPYPKIIVKQIKISLFQSGTIPTAIIFIKIHSKLSLQKYFIKLQKKFSKNGISFSIKLEGNIKQGFDYQVSVFRPKGSDFLCEKFPEIANFFQINSCSGISWKIDNYGDINFEIK
jgi:hypothetical protein